MTTCRWLLCIAGITLFSSSLYASSPERMARHVIAPSYPQLHKQAQEQGLVRVLVRYGLETRDSSSVTGRQQARGLIEALARRLQLTTLKSMKRHPLQVYELNPDQLDAMLDSGLFELIVEDGLNFPQLEQSISLIEGELAHNFGLTGNGAAVAVLDTGIDNSHQAFSGRIVEEACFSTRSARYGSTSLCPNGQSSACWRLFIFIFPRLLPHLYLQPLMRDRRMCAQLLAITEH